MDGVEKSQQITNAYLHHVFKFKFMSTKLNKVMDMPHVRRTIIPFLFWVRVLYENPRVNLPQVTTATHYFPHNSDSGNLLACVVLAKSNPRLISSTMATTSISHCGMLYMRVWDDVQKCTSCDLNFLTSLHFHQHYIGSENSHVAPNQVQLHIHDNLYGQQRPFSYGILTILPTSAVHTIHPSIRYRTYQKTKH